MQTNLKWADRKQKRILTFCSWQCRPLPVSRPGERDYECNVMVYVRFMLSWHEIRFDLGTPSYVSICSFRVFRSEVKGIKKINFNFIFSVLRNSKIIPVEGSSFWMCNFGNGFSHNFYIFAPFGLGFEEHFGFSLPFSWRKFHRRNFRILQNNYVFGANGWKLV